MPVCPKCEFHGQDPDTCERCGIIYSRMHTVLEPRPPGLTAALEEHARRSGSMPAVQTPPSVPPADPMSDVGGFDVDVDIDAGGTIPAIHPPVNRPTSRVVPAIAQAFPGMQTMPPGGMRSGEFTPAHVTRPPQREVTIVPMVPPPERKSRLPLLVGLLSLVLVGWGVAHVVESHRSRNLMRVAEADPAINEDYFTFQINELVDDMRRSLREVKDPAITAKQRDAFGIRLRYLRTKLVVASLDDAAKATVMHSLDELTQFLKTDVGSILTALEAERTKATEATAEGEGTVLAAASPAPSSAPAEVKTAIAPPTPVAAPSPAPVPVGRKPNLAALSRATTLLASLKRE